MFFSNLIITFLINAGLSCNFVQKIEIDTSLHLLQPSPLFMSSQEALKGHNEFETRIKHGSIDISKDFYLIFRYRDPHFIPFWKKIIAENNDNPILIMWFINAIEQMGNRRNLSHISIYKNSLNGIVRECAANAYGFLASKDSIPMLQEWYSREENGYIRETIGESIKAIRKNGYKNKIPYLPRYYKEKPLKLDYLYNVKVNDDFSMQYDEIDTARCAVKSSRFIYPFQQYIWKLKNTTLKGFFGSHTGPVFHVGKDAGWLYEGLPVHSICNGIVKEISHNLSWGNLVVVESVLKDSDTICVIYGHLSPYNNLNVGDTVSAGDRIGQIGNSVTPDNGGYWAHLHLGIEKSSFRKDEALEYLNHPLLGKRLIECTNIVNNIGNRSALEIFGEIDVLKFRSSMTLFDHIQQKIDVFKIALNKYFGGVPDKRTCSILMKINNQKS